MCLPVHFQVPKIELFIRVQLNRYKALVNFSFEFLLLHKSGTVYTHSCAMQAIRSYQLNSLHKYCNFLWIYPSRCPNSFIRFSVFSKTTVPSKATSPDRAI